MVRLAALDDVELGALEILDGERVALLGGSGSGKTVIIKRLLGLQGGPMRRRGSPLSDRCAYVPQSDGVFLDASVLENVTQPSVHVPSVPESEARDYLDLVGLSSRITFPVAGLSIADRRRVALARALSRRRPLLVIDGILDPTIGALLPDLLETIPHVRSLLFTSCVIDSAVGRADRVALVDGCHVLAQDTLIALRASMDPDVRAALTWVAP
ncbi:ATP-binding cassette domain-containing protein [Nocardioides fonticola]|uniref:ATP-binding cassette domain-containing protein n=1 Tax=Nocardioides fonticola TaxID=450363 RepID=A0ABP7XH31_9ACTN